MGKNFYQNVADTVAQNRANVQNADSLGQFANTALQVYQQHLQQQKDDTLANMFMASQNKQNDQNYAVQNAKPATAVMSNDPDLVGTPQYNDTNPGTVFQYRNGASPGDPPTASQEAYDNGMQGYGYNTNPTLPAAPGDLPANGGMAGLKLSFLMDQNRTRNLMANLRTSTALARTNAANDPNSLAAQRLALEKQREARLAAGGNGGGMGAQRGPQPQADTIQKLNNDVQTTYGADLNELHDAGADDIVQQNNGVLYRLGGGKGANGQVQPKRNVFIPQDAHDQLMQRYNGILTGKPMIINQSQMNAVRNFQAGGDGMGGGGPTPTSAMQMYQNAANPSDPTMSTGLPQGSSAATGALFGSGDTAAGAPTANAAGSATGTAPSSDDLLEWAQANADDPRAAQVLQKLGMQQ